MSEAGPEMALPFLFRAFLLEIVKSQHHVEVWINRCTPQAIYFQAFWRVEF
jgi:hypothetical protein